MTPQPVPETLTNAELLELAYDAFDDLLSHGIDFEIWCSACFDSITALQDKIEERLDEIDAPDDPHNKTSMPPGTL